MRNSYKFTTNQCYFGKITNNEISHWGLMTLDKQKELVLYFSDSVSEADKQKLLEGKLNNSDIFRTSKSIKSQYAQAIQCLNISKSIDSFPSSKAKEDLSYF